MPEKGWLEVSLVVNGELAEAVAEVLARYIPEGIVIESTAVTAGPDDEGGKAVGPLRVCGYLPVDEHLEETQRRIEEALWYLGRIQPLPTPEIKPIQEVNWVENWKEHYHPIPVGKRLIIVPAWLDTPKGERIAIRIDPGMAFGTGTHPTTQLCLALLDSLMTSEEQSAKIVKTIDIGCGSGVLSIAALKLGAQQALGVDIDPLAVDASLHNAVANGVGDEFELGVGSVAEVRAGKFSLDKGEVVLANILAPIIIRLFDEGLADLLAPAGWLILSGILIEQSPQVEVVAEKHGLQIIEKQKSGDWTALAARKIRI